MWTHVRRMNETEKVTVFLTTHYMEEAERVAQRIAVIDHGLLIAEGTPDELKLQVGGERVELVPADRGDAHAAKGVLERVAVGEVVVEDDGRRLTAPVRDGAAALRATAPPARRAR